MPGNRFSILMISRLLECNSYGCRKLRLTLVIEEHFEFTIRAAHTVKISVCAHCIVRLPLDFRHTTAIQPPYNRHTTAIVSKYRYISTGIYTSFAL